ncbi:hypothetical protein EIP91_001132 [Steccherinum ochraceum]|uniref:Uncharacterized protein n=1 Tax=Steccherinum ochraceum TaxID=92696 RepID=A0A4R0RHM2_9APHY|nr:hypothetical protein EIP91_001132 [Steccherinum ochraceum]
MYDPHPPLPPSDQADGLGLDTDLSYSMSNSPRFGSGGSFGYDSSSYSHVNDLPPSNSLLLNTSHGSPSSPFNDPYTFTHESSPTDAHFPGDINYNSAQQPRTELPRIAIPSHFDQSPHFELASPSYLGHHSLTASPSTSGRSNNSPFTPSGMHPLSPAGNPSFFSPPTMMSPYLAPANADTYLGVPHSPVSPSYTGLGLYANMSSKSPAYPSFAPHTPSIASYSPGMDSSHSFDDQPAMGMAPMAYGSSAHQTVLELAALYPVPGVMLPQRTYRPHTQSDRRRYVEEVVLEAPIMFAMQNPTGFGIPCRDALNSKFMRLTGRDDQMFSGRGPSVSIRLMWPGYASWSRQIPTRDFRTPPGPITRAKLAKNVAKTVQRFLDDMADRALEEDADPRWKVGRGSITIDDLEIVGLQHVSMGSWQVHLRVRNQPRGVYTNRADYRDPLKNRARK